jgi:hypothetical protein
MMIGGRMNFSVGVGEGMIKMGGIMMINPWVGVEEGINVGVALGRMGVGGATIKARVSGMQIALVTVLETHACPLSPPANSMYHQVPS